MKHSHETQGGQLMFKALLKQKGYKTTPTRLAILSQFSESHEPLNAENIAKKVGKGKVNEATVYRTLLSFTEVGILRQVDLRKGTAHYELASDHHHHIVCVKCGDIEDVERCGMEQISKQILGRSKKFKIVSDHSFELFGLCKTCA